MIVPASKWKMEFQKLFHFSKSHKKHTQNRWLNWELKRVYLRNNINFNHLFLPLVRANLYADTIQMLKEIFYNLQATRLQNQMHHQYNLELKRYNTKQVAVMEIMQMQDLQQILQFWHKKQKTFRKIFKSDMFAFIIHIKLINFLFQYNNFILKIFLEFKLLHYIRQLSIRQILKQRRLYTLLIDSK